MKRSINLLAGCLLCSLHATPLARSGEYELKAAYIFHFTKYVEFPDSAFSGSSSRFVVGILGQDRFGSALDSAFEGRSVDGHPVVVKRFTDLAQTKGCHILIISSSEKQRISQIVSSLKGHSTLTVGDSPGMAEKGVVIELYIEENKVRFFVNVASARSSRLKISSKLLSLAKRVIGN